MTITRKLPNSNLGRQNAINRAAIKQSTITPGNEVLHPQTAARLVLGQPQYNNALNNANGAQALLSTNTPLKVAAVASCKTYASHFIQVFNFGVVRGKYPAGHRAYYGLPIESSALPPMVTDVETVEWAQRLISGDPTRVLAGGAAMANPDVAELTTATNSANVLLITQNTLTQTLKERQEDVNDINPEADKLILRMWDDVEAYFGEDTPESTRANGRLWGIVYVTEGPAAILTGLVRDAAGNPRVDAEVVVIETGAKVVTNAEGRYSLPTTVIGTATVQATFMGEIPATTTVLIPDHEEEIIIPVVDIVVG
jgi:hypothetical protein